MKRPLALGSLISLCLVWLAYASAGHPLAAWIGHKWGPRIVRAGDGTFFDPVVFLQNRFHEACWLLTVSVIVLGLAAGLGALWARRLSALWQWIPYAVTGFAGVNVWLKLASATCLFWCFFWNGKGTTDNFTQFHIKLPTLDEDTAPVKVVLAGSSQVRAQIDRRVLNRELWPAMFTTELHFPGNRGYDFLLLDSELEGHKADIIICYLSEGLFYGQNLSPGFPLFFRFRNLPEFLRLGGSLTSEPKAVEYALLGNLLPAFRLRDPVTQRLLGDEVGLRQGHPLWSVAADLHQRAVEAAAAFRTNALNQFHVVAYEAFVARCRAQHRTVVCCWGQLNPILARELDPELRPQLHAFLSRLASRYDNFVLLDTLPVQTEEDYEDLTHVNQAAQVRFTKALAPILREVAARREQPGRAGAK